MTLAFLTTIVAFVVNFEFDDDIVNSMCPVSKLPIDGKTESQFDGQIIGLCCAKCKAVFDGWSHDQKTQYLTALKSTDEKVEKPRSPANPFSDPYPLTKCLVSGHPLTAMGTLITKVVDGREFRFCCRKCVMTFEDDPQAVATKLDAEIIKDQKTVYPTTRCVVMGKALVEDEVDTGIDVVFRNRLFRVCCKKCIWGIEGQTDKIVAALDKAVIEKQRKDYPFETCVASGGKLGSMGEPVDIVVHNRLLRLCCRSCIPKVRDNPSRYTGKVDAARKLKTTTKNKNGAGDVEK